MSETGDPGISMTAYGANATFTPARANGLGGMDGNCPHPVSPESDFPKPRCGPITARKMLD
jgi:hypothetical protein